MKNQEMKWYFIIAVFLAVLMVGIATDVKAAKKIKIGVIGPMKYLVGEHQWMGAQLAAEQINKAGGIAVGSERRMVELVKVDDNNLLSVSDAVSAIERAITVDKVDFLTGGGRSEANLAQQEVMAKYKKIFMNASSGAMQLSMRIAKNYDKYKYWFRVGMFNGKYTGGLIFANVELVAKKIRKDLGIATPNVAIIAEKVMWPDAIIKAAKAQLPKMGMKLVGVWRPSASATDTTSELTAIKNKRAHIIFTIGGGPVDTVWSVQYGELQIPAAMVGLSTDALRSKFWKDSRGNCNYQLVMSYLADLPGKTFYKEYRERFNDDPIFHSLTYDAIYVVKEAIERCGTVESDAVVAELEKTDFQSFRGRIVFHPKDHATPHDLIWGPKYATGFGLQWQDGKLVPVLPRGDAVLGDERWKGINYSTAEYKLPPRMIKYWKSKK
ncbi:MAG: ABC transporter substrate-binding protein [Thermodesulfobacteriota bacterium]|nr:ABC transporter substrate-binding protein [Thermodesulfobacteriota bacterium]